MSTRNWSQAEVVFLLQLRSDDAIDGVIKGTCTDSPAYNLLEQQMRDAGFHRSKKQIISKLKTIKSAYFKVKAHNKVSGVEKKYIENEELCDIIWGKKPSCAPLNIISSSKTKEMMEDLTVDHLSDTASTTGLDSTEDEMEDNYDSNASMSERHERGGEDMEEEPGDSVAEAPGNLIEVEDQAQAHRESRKRPGTASTVRQDAGDGQDHKKLALPSTSKGFYGATKKRTSKKTKLQSAIGSMSDEIRVALTEGNELYEAREKEKEAEQRRWEEMMEERHHSNQINLIKQLNAGQLQYMQMFSAMFHAVSGQQQTAPGFGNPPPGFGNPPPDFGNPPPAFGNPPPAFGNPSPAFGNPPPAFGNPPAAFGNPPPALCTPPPAQGTPPSANGNPPPAYGNPHPIYRPSSGQSSSFNSGIRTDHRADDQPTSRTHPTSQHEYKDQPESPCYTDL